METKIEPAPPGYVNINLTVREKHARAYLDSASPSNKNKYLFILGADHLREATTGKSSRTLHDGYSEIHPDENIINPETKMAHSILRALKWTGIIAVTSLITLLLGYLVASRWYDNRIVNPYGYGGFGGYGGYGI